MRARLLVAAAAWIAAQAHAQVSGFAQLRSVERAGLAPRCALSGCHAMVDEALAEVLLEGRMTEHSPLALRVDALRDAISGDQQVSVREATVAWRGVADADIKLGRQIITWGVSDYFYVNDIFPKNYDEFFTGASVDRIKVPVDAAHLTWHGPAEFDVVISTSKADRSPSPARFVAMGAASTAVPDAQARDSGVDAALKVSANVGRWDVAAYAAIMKSRERRDFADAQGLHFDRPRLRHLGASLTGNVASGVLWMEAALRHVDAGRVGVVDRMFLGSSAKFIVGYSRDLADEVTASAQLQVETALDRGRYEQSLAPGVRPVAQLAPMLHLRMQGHWVNQTVGAGAQLFAGTKGDLHVNPFASWSPVDGWTLEAGANLFRGRPDTRFGALRHDSNVYASARYSY